MLARAPSPDPFQEVTSLSISTISFLEPEPEPAKIKPYYETGPVLPPSDEVERPKRHGPKVKTRPSPPSPPGTVQDDTTVTVRKKKEEETPTPTPPLPVFWVKKDVYDTFEKLFLGGKVKGTIDTWEFEKVKIHVFSLGTWD